MNDMIFGLVIAVIVLAIWNVYLTFRMEITHHIIAEMDYILEKLNESIDKEDASND